MKYPEILAPAGNLNQLIAAVQAGCDAVYLGASSFSARASAENFALNELSEVIDYCHEYGVKVYVAMNILLKDRELHKATEQAKDLWALGVDALIVTDPGLIRNLQTMPEIELHASTQTSIHHPKQAAFYKEQGITRAILARELSAEEIKAMTSVMECEIFIQGALCISYSGQCLMSSLFGGRSGNRGRCAQPCRLTYQLKTSDKLSDTSHRLSPKDLSLLPKSNELLDLGVASLKIEGRLRSPAYVIEAVKAYRDALSGNLVTLSGLERTFNRGGYTQDYFEGVATHDMMARHSPKHQGQLIGTSADKILLQADVSVGDGLTSGESGFRIEELKHHGRSVKTARAGDMVEIFPKKYQPNSPLYKNFDVALNDNADQLVKTPFARKIEVAIELEFLPGKPLKLTAGEIEVLGEEVQIAKSAPISIERLTQALEKSGDTPFSPKVINTIYEPGFLAMGQINTLRRELIEKLSLKTKVRRSRPEPSKTSSEYTPKEIPTKLITIRKSSHVSLLSELDEICLNPFYQDPGSLTKAEVEEFTRPFYLHLPTVLRAEYDETIHWVKSLPNCLGVVTANVAALSELSDMVRIGDAKLNIFNSQGAKLYQVDGFIPSEELNRQELKELKNQEQVLMSVYGKAELMLMDYCQTRTGYPCKRPCNHQPIGLVDRKGETIMVAHDIFCRSHLLNPKRKNLLSLVEDIRSLGIERFYLELTDESMDEAAAILNAFRQGTDTLLDDVTYGHYKRGVE